MADDLDDLQRLAPAVDSERARASFRRRRRRSRSTRRGGMALAAVTVLVAGTVGVVANLDDGAPVVAGPGEAVPTGPVTFEVLTVATASDEMGTLRSAIDDGGYANLWKYANTSDPGPELDFAEQVVVSITIPDDACPPELTAFDRDGEVLTPVFVETTEGCVQPLIPKTFVVAIDRATVGSSFTLRLPADPIYGFEEQRLTVVLDPGGSKQGGQPTVWTQEPSPSDEGFAAMVGGVVRYDAGNGCFLVGADERWFPVVWPAGTTGTADGPGVVLPDGQVARVGDEVAGGGGYLDVADEYGIPDACLPDTGEIAVFNPNEDVEVNRAPALPGPEPTCTEIEAFADQLVDTGIDYDYTASASPEALLDDVDLVAYGTLTGGFDVRPGDGGAQHDLVGYEVDVRATYKSPPGADPTNPLTIWVRSGKHGPEGAVYREAIAPGAPAVVFAHLDPQVGFTASIEGFATGCPSGPPLGFTGTVSEWTELTSLDDLVSRLEAAAR